MKDRFIIDHGTIHDLVTGRHVRTDPDFGPGRKFEEDGIEECCALLNKLASSPPSPTPPAPPPQTTPCRHPYSPECPGCQVGPPTPQPTATVDVEAIKVRAEVVLDACDRCDSDTTCAPTEEGLTAEDREACGIVARFIGKVSCPDAVADAADRVRALAKAR